MIKWFHYVPFSRLPDALALGWLPSASLTGTVHGEYACLCERVCECGRMSITIVGAA
jgi:hypothetical protein